MYIHYTYGLYIVIIPSHYVTYMRTIICRLYAIIHVYIPDHNLNLLVISVAGFFLAGLVGGGEGG